jgi:hypothetical protein
MKSLSERSFTRNKLAGRVPLLLLWLIGIPVPVLVILFLLRGCS